MDANGDWEAVKGPSRSLSQAATRLAYKLIICICIEINFIEIICIEMICIEIIIVLY